MNTKTVYALFNELGISPSYKGYPYLIHLVCLATDYRGKPFPCLKELHRLTATHFGVSENRVKDDIRTLLRNYWEQKNAARFAAIIGYPVRDQLTPKEFVAIISEYLAFNSRFLDTPHS